ncbi:ribonuclease III [uncultured Pseudokineococcus sp.]|uniref:ribonuclease III n=1 Tax=uncultured Pseudokineococcus sp. TaxID=1642928 RepID=UPI0034523E14
MLELVPRAAELQARLGLEVEPGLLLRALVHRSWSYEHDAEPTNERLEFLGDAVLGLVVTDALYRRHPDLPEGQLAKLRASVVSSRALAGVGRGLDLGGHVLLGRGERSTGGRDKTSILADTVEAVIGAAYLSAGLDEARALVHRLVDPLLASSAALGAGLDWKTSLQELAAAREDGPPVYEVTGEGPDHARTFTALVLVGGVPQGQGEGRSKKEAEQRAAEAAWRALGGTGEDELARAAGVLTDGAPAEGAPSRGA